MLPSWSGSRPVDGSVTGNWSWIQTKPFCSLVCYSVAVNSSTNQFTYVLSPSGRLCHVYWNSLLGFLRSRWPLTTNVKSVRSWLQVNILLKKILQSFPDTLSLKVKTGRHAAAVWSLKHLSDQLSNRETRNPQVQIPQTCTEVFTKCILLPLGVDVRTNVSFVLRTCFCRELPQTWF